MADRIVTGTWKARPRRGSELIIDVPPPSASGPTQGTDTDQIGVEPVLGHAILVTVRWSDGTTGEYSGTVHPTARLRSVSPDTAMPVSPVTRFRYRHISI